MNSSPADIAAAALGVAPERVVAVERIKHGLTNQSWRVRTSDDVVVVRISTADEDALRIDRASETRILEAVAAAGIGAPVLHCNPAHHTLVTRYLGPAWSFEDAARERNIERLARLLRRLHATPPPEAARTVDLHAAVAGYIASLNAHGAGGELVSRTLQQRAREAAALLQRNAAPVLCHNDVHHLNVVDGGASGPSPSGEGVRGEALRPSPSGEGAWGEGLSLIDWEYAGLGERLFDLASVCVYHRYARAQREMLLGAYGVEREPALDARLDAALWLFEYIRDLWLAVRAGAER